MDVVNLKEKSEQGRRKAPVMIYINCRRLRARQPPQIPRGLGPLPLPVKKWQGAAPCIS